jgi:hypothetical protein
MSTVHVHLDHDNCLEVILVRGKSAMNREIGQFADRDAGREARAVYADGLRPRPAVNSRAATS